MVFQNTITGPMGPAAAAPSAGVLPRAPWLLLSLAAMGVLGLGSGYVWAGPLLLAPVLEEVIFRLGLHEWLLERQRSPGTWQRLLPAALLPAALLPAALLPAALLPATLTAAAFAATHVALRPGLVSALTLLPALAIGAFYERRRALLPCVALHCAFNALWLLLAGRLA